MTHVEIVMIKNLPLFLGGLKSGWEAIHFSISREVNIPLFTDNINLPQSGFTPVWAQIPEESQRRKIFRIIWIYFSEKHHREVFKLHLKTVIFLLWWPESCFWSVSAICYPPLFCVIALRKVDTHWKTKIIFFVQGCLFSTLSSDMDISLTT